MSATASAPSTPSFMRRAMKQKRFTFGFTVTVLIVAFARPALLRYRTDLPASK